MSAPWRLVPKILDEPAFDASHIVEAFDSAFRRYWGQDFCQT
jgi:hypothetical protein